MLYIAYHEGSGDQLSSWSGSTVTVAHFLGAAEVGLLGPPLDEGGGGGAGLEMGGGGGGACAEDIIK